PGRFFAAMEMKTLMAHLIMTHDVSLADGVRPNDEWYAGIRVPNITAECVQFPFSSRPITNVFSQTKESSSGEGKLWLNLYFYMYSSHVPLVFIRLHLRILQSSA
ncbi:hypothetical protein DFH09DRAFT_909023, partial [Mycena vulgaris]